MGLDRASLLVFPGIYRFSNNDNLDYKGVRFYRSLMHVFDLRKTSFGFFRKKRALVTCLRKGNSPYTWSSFIECGFLSSVDELEEGVRYLGRSDITFRIFNEYFLDDFLKQGHLREKKSF